MRLGNPIVLIWMVLMIFLAATVGASFLLTGALGAVVGLGIAIGKSAFIYWRYMHLGEERGLPRVAALGAFAWLAILLMFVTVEMLTRSQ